MPRKVLLDSGAVTHNTHVGPGIAIPGRGNGRGRGQRAELLFTGTWPTIWGVEETPTIPAQRIVVVMPNWLGDGVMATPLLRALRRLYPAAHIVALHKPLLATVLAGLPFVDRAVEYPCHGAGGTRKIDGPATVRWLRVEKFDLAILLPNSFRSAWLAWRAGIPRRVGYARENRGWMLTAACKAPYRSYEEWRTFYARTWARVLIKDHLNGVRGLSGHLVTLDPVPTDHKAYAAAFENAGGARLTKDLRVGFDLARWLPALRGYQPAPMIDYYLELARRLGAAPCDRRMELGVADAERAEAQEALEAAGLADDTPLVVLVPGANFGSSKCWPPERFAAIADALVDPQGPYRAAVILAGAPAEKPVIAAILDAAGHGRGGHLLWSGALAGGRGISVGALKEIVRRSRLMVCNDTGPRHFAAAFGVPTVTLFGPTDQRWAETFSSKEISLQAAVPCGPCQLKRCPIDQRCLKLLTVDMVLAAVARVAGTGFGSP